MFSLIDVVELLDSEIEGLSFYPLEFPLTAPINTAVVEMESNSTSTAKVFEVNVQVKVRDHHPSVGESDSHRIRAFLEKKTNFMLADVQVVYAESQNPVPLYMGKDLKGNHLYSNNFRLICNEGVIL